MIIRIRYWFLVYVLGLLFLSGCSSETVESPAPTQIETPISTSVSTPTQVETSISTSESTTTQVETPISTSASTPAQVETPTSTSVVTPTLGDVPEAVADIIEVSVSGEPGSYRFSVTVSSPDEGCNQYADWWEVVDEQGELVYRRILLHSHVGEQPFTRSGGPVNIEPDDLVWVRAHMHPIGYGGAVMKGSIAQGFVDTELGFDFSPELAESPPLPEGCDF